MKNRKDNRKRVKKGKTIRKENYYPLKAQLPRIREKEKSGRTRKGTRSEGETTRGCAQNLVKTFKKQRKLNSKALKGGGKKKTRGGKCSKKKPA